MTTLKEIENNLLHECPNFYKLDGYLHDHKKPLEVFLEEFVLHLRNKYVTVSNNAKINFVVCGVGKNRTIGEIFLIARYYYPDCSYKEVRFSLTKNKKIQIIKCGDVDDFVCTTGFGYLYEGYKSSKKDKYGLPAITDLI